MEVALFPIPGSVCFPGVSCPLHVFEPRYRQMVRHCLENDLPLGVCHTQKVLHARKSSQSLPEALNSNQSTHKPVRVFSAGPVELLEELPDGRLLISVHAQQRLQLGTERQTLPFAIWDCEVLADQEASGPEAIQLQATTQASIIQRLLDITQDNPAAQEQLGSHHWLEMTPHDFSFAVCGVLGMPPDLAQELLETTDTGFRLTRILGLLEGEQPPQPA